MKILPKYIFNSFLLILLISSCNTLKEINEEAIYGTYQWYGAYGIASNITLNPDNTFIYYWQIGLTNGNTLGTWKIGNNFLVLNSERQFREKEKFNVLEKRSQDSLFYEFTIIDKKNKTLQGVNSVYLLDSTFVGGTSSDSLGIMRIPLALNFDKLRLSYLGYNEIEIHKSELPATSCTIILLDFTDQYEFFINRKWKIEYGKLIDPNIRLDRYTKRNYYEKLME